eukprot:COSAG02_NODE_277_length_25939_cov_108.963971_13_plen_259_part_00
MQATNIIWNFHPYMGPPQAGAHDKCPAGFEAHIVAVTNGTDRPSIITEFGQACCPTGGVCESCPASYGGVSMGYDEAVLTIAAKYGVSWLPWAWRPPAGPETNSGRKCEDVNGGSSPPGLSLAGSNSGNGGDFAVSKALSYAGKLWLGTLRCTILLTCHRGHCTGTVEKICWSFSRSCATGSFTSLAWMSWWITCQVRRVVPFLPSGCPPGLRGTVPKTMWPCPNPRATTIATIAGMPGWQPDGLRKTMSCLSTDRSQ